jgi:hypothetical protein
VLILGDESDLYLHVTTLMIPNYIKTTVMFFSHALFGSQAVAKQPPARGRRHLHSSMSSRKLLPIITVQPTFRTVISEVDTGVIPSDDFWVSCYKESSPSVHSKIHVKVNEVHRDVVDLEPADSRVQIQAQIKDVS